MSKDKYLVIRGELHWAKIVGPARAYTGNPKFDKGPLWSVDITPDAKSLHLIKEAGIEDKLREPKGEKETRTAKFLTLKMLENKPDGGKNRSPKISDIMGRPWGDTEIGNGSIADIKIKVKDYGTTVGVYYQEARILRLVEYSGKGFEPLSPDDEFFAATGSDSPAAEDNPPFDTEEVDDDVPY